MIHASLHVNVLRIPRRGAGISYRRFVLLDDDKAERHGAKPVLNRIFEISRVRYHLGELALVDCIIDNLIPLRV